MNNKDNQKKPLSTGPHQFNMTDWISCAPFENLLKMEIIEASGGKAVLRMPFFIQLAQGAGLMHGGALVSLADTAVVMAIKSIIPPHSHFGTISIETKFLYPVKEGIVTAKAEVVEHEGRILKGEAVVYNKDEKPLIEFKSTFKVARDTNIKGINFSDSNPDQAL